MPYCPKCGNKVDEIMAFCPSCGVALKGTASSQLEPKSEKEENQEKQKNSGKGNHGFVGFLMGGLILITIGAFAILDLTSSVLSSGLYLVIMLAIIGIIIIIGAVYVATTSRKQFPVTHLSAS